MVALVSLVHLAAYWGWRNVVTALVSVYKCAANCKDEKGHIPLHYAAYNGHLEVVKYFVVELLCDPMDRNNDGWTPLHSACDNGHLNIAQYLIREEHCNPSCENNVWQDTTSLMLVLMVTSTLPSTSSERNTVIHHVRTIMASTPLHYACACRHGNLNIAQYLIREEHCNPSCEDKYGETPLHYACSQWSPQHCPVPHQRGTL